MSCFTIGNIHDNLDPVILIESSRGESLGLTGMQTLASFIDIMSPIFYKKMYSNLYHDIVCNYQIVIWFDQHAEAETK